MRAFMYCAIAALLGVAVASGQNREAEKSANGNPNGVEVLTRGPIHEAFAGTVTFNPEPGVVVPKTPPEAIEEVPPDQRPQGENVSWIPGYWAWDDERGDFLWVSGIWRNLPPGRQWVPGYWGQSETGAQWASGYWADAATSEVVYLAEPPESVENGPNIVATSGDQVWIPGCWLWQNNRYAWRPGNWAAGQQNWVWVPAYYAWTQRGYVFVDGYYDYSVANRGVLFAPVYFNSGAYAQRRVSYSPNTVINSAVFASQLFLRPNYHHYYCGDYYAASYTNAGYYPWFTYRAHHHGYDPIYAQQRWQNRGSRDWEQHLQSAFQHRRDHAEARPPRTWAALNAVAANRGNGVPPGVVAVAALSQLVKSNNSPLRFQPVSVEEQQQLIQHGQNVQAYRQERRRLETVAATPMNPTSRMPGPTKLTLPKSPFVARSAEQLGQEHTPPKRHEVLKPNLLIEPRPRVRSGTVPNVKPRTTSPIAGPNSAPGSKTPRTGKDSPNVPKQPRPKVAPHSPQPASPSDGPGADKPKGKGKDE